VSAEQEEKDARRVGLTEVSRFYKMRDWLRFVDVGVFHVLRGGYVGLRGQLVRQDS